MQNTPKWSGSATLGYTTPAGDGEVSFSTTASFKSKTYQFEVPNPYLDQTAYALLDASLVYTAPGGRWSLGVHGKNLFDKEYKTSGYTYVTFDGEGNPVSALGKEGILTAYYGNPRQVFATATLQF